MPDKKYDLTIAATYYEPYVSGFTQTVRSIAEGLSNRGWRVAVVAAQHDPELPLRDVVGGVDVYRSPVLMRAGRRLIAPRYPILAGQVAGNSSLLHLNLPTSGAGLLTSLARRVPMVSMLHADPHLPQSRFSQGLRHASDVAYRAAIRRSDAVVATSHDQAYASRFWPVIRHRNFTPIAPPCLDRRGGQPHYRETRGLHVGFLGRIVADKGIGYLVRAFQRITDPDARLLIAGNYHTAAGRSDLPVVQAEIDRDSRVRILGELRGREVNDLYASIDVFALPTVAGSFGTVLAEAMMCGVPSVTTDLPGSRYPVTATGFGRLIPAGDPRALERAISELATAPREWKEQKARAARARFSVATSLDAHEVLFTSLRERTASRQHR
ncbi:glycosyltransferase family 4 protein [Micromonospora endophytica]|uniref:Glycosyl transferase n=1 Tax=Micromonospora endophytica TaxID=515350 RepID=A0A2W2DIB0_9ACTN|nr:glycosyltransferase family 4 protein [Micromonospora endophytica]PZF99477.1 glycosyl transferase [Micromonospora endophytica]RIW40277.1 glycosyltransferase family 1 protein [Micromonospora endophytica]BCJ58144.1 glycosyl transferase family 1 [Micromonospora endophytica]